jgi:SAM-dependent methyltransferase
MNRMMRRYAWRARWPLLLALVLFAMAMVLSRPGRVRITQRPSPTPDLIYVPTPQPVVDKMLELAEIGEGDVVYDLGCGDGRIVVTAARQYGVRAVGVDISPRRVREARDRVAEAGVEDLVTIRQADFFQLDLRPATVVTLYLVPELNVRLMPQLATLSPGSRIVSHNAPMPGARPVEVLCVDRDGMPLEPDQSEYPNGKHTLYKWVVPWEH